MQTFLPYPNFAHSAAALDRQRLGKQRVECQQIMAVIDEHGHHGMPSGWVNHPAVKMWRGYRSALAVYMTICCIEWERRGYAQNIVTPYSPLTWMRHSGYPGELVEDARRAPVPWWLGRAEFHESHQRALLQKDPEHYRQFGWRVVPELNYWWPSRVEEESAI